MVNFAKLFEKEAEEDVALKNYAARLPVYGVDPETGLTNYTNPVVPELKLPVQGIHDQPYIPTQYDMKGPVRFLPAVQEGAGNVRAIMNEGFESSENIAAKVFGPIGGNDVERVQTWPEKMIRSGASLPTDVMAGRVLSGPGLRATDFSDIPGAPQPLSNLIERTQDLAGLAAGGSVAATGLKAERPGILARGAKTLKDRLTEAFAEELHNAPTDVLGGQAEVRRNGNGRYDIWDKDKNELWITEGKKGMSKEDAQYQADMINKSASDRTFRLNADNEASTAISSLATRMNETMPEILARQRASEGYEAAIRDPETKKLYTGMWHEEVLDKIAKDKGIPKDQLPTNLVKGYMNDRGQFLSEAALERRQQARANSKTAMFRSDDEAGTAIAALSKTPEFKNWFSNSKITNEKGEPLIVYHGTKSKFDTFEKTGLSDEGLAGKGFYFTYNPEEAHGIAHNPQFGKGNSPNVMPAYVNVKNPFVIKQGVLPDGRKISEVNGRPITAEGGNKIKKLAENGGHDGVVWTDINGNVRHVAVWDSKQIKSATGNNGKFDPKSSNIFRSDDIVGTGLAAVQAPRFYSHMENVINDAKMMVRNAEGKRVEVPQEKFNSNELNAYLKNKGVSNEEIEALKLPEFLEGKKSVTKQELLNHLNENKVELQEHWKGEHPQIAEIAKIETRKREIYTRLKDIQDQFNSYKGGDTPAVHKARKELADEEKALKAEHSELVKKDDELGKNPYSKPRFAQYQLAGGSNYRELLLSLKDNPIKVKRIEEINKELDQIRKEKLELKPDYLMKVNTEADAIKRKKTNDKHTELQSRQEALASELTDLGNAFTTDHWPGNKDIVVHSRMNDRFIPDESGPSKGGDYTHIPNGRGSIVKQGQGYNTLHAEEIQSDLHQKGNSEGYRLSLKDKNKLEPEFNRIEEKIMNYAEKTGDDSIISNPDLKDVIKLSIDKKIITEAEAKIYLRYADSERYNAVKDAPFKSTWSDVMIKRLIRQASEEGKDAISWTPGQEQIDRYPGLQQHFDRVEYNPKTEEFKAYDKKGILAARENLNKSKLVDYIGKESTDKLLNSPSRKSTTSTSNDDIHVLDNADLKVGGEFHKKFYDEIMVNKVNAIAKKYGARVEEKEINNNQLGWHKIWFLKLTPELKKAALERGFSLFETGLPLTPVDHDPFERKKHKLVPVPHNPFQ